MPRVDAGNNPTGLAVCDISGNGIPDLLVSNAQGDLLIILGNGNGTFRPYQRADQGVSLALGDFGSNGQTEYVLSNVSIDQLSIQYGETQTFVQGRSQGIQAPGAVAVADLSGNGMLDIIVLNSGENDMLVYLGLGGNRFEAPLRFFTGTDPVGLTVADLTGTGIPDIIVANAGSNDLSIFIGVGQGTNWTLEARPRLPVGNDPVSTTVADLDGGGIPDIICVDQGSNNVEVLRGVGGGFFNDNAALVLPAGPSPTGAFVGKFDAGPGLGLAVLDSSSSDLYYYSNFASGTSAPQLIPTGGPNPVAAVTGSYGNDGDSDLFIAHQGDSRIAFLDGGPDGLVLADFFNVGQPVQPTDLAVSGGPSGSIQIYIATAGTDQVVLLSVWLGISSPLVGPSGGYSLQPAAATPGAGGRGLLLSSPGDLLGIEGSMTESSAQVPASTQAETTSGAGAGASAQAVVAMGGIGVTLPQIITPSMAPLSFLVSDLVQMGQVQVSDLMPLDHSALDAVAVLIVVSGSAGEEAIDHHNGSLEDTEAGAAILVAPYSGGTSSLERFLADNDDALADVPRDVLASTSEPIGPRPEWVWQPGKTQSVAVAGPRGPRPWAPSLDARLGPHTAPDDDPGAGFTGLLSLNPGTLEHSSTAEADPDFAGWAGRVAKVFVVSSLVFAGRAAWNRRRAGQSRPIDRRTPVVRSSRLARHRDNSGSLRAQHDRSQDLPPWLAEASPGRWRSPS